MDRDLEPIARVVHEALRAWAKAHGQTEMPSWEDAPDWMRESTEASIQFVLDHPRSRAGAQHRQWMKQRREQGWTYGEVRDDERKLHPMLIPFKDLPELEKQKDHLLIGIVKALT